MDPLLIVALVCAALGVGFLSVAAGALKRRRLFRGLVSVLSALLMITLAALMVTITVAVQGYRALTREEVAATAVIQPAGPQLFMATLLFPDGRQQTFRIAGDQLYVDARAPGTSIMGRLVSTGISVRVRGTGVAGYSSGSCNELCDLFRSSCRKTDI